MMSLLFRDLSHPVYKVERLLEIGKGKRPRDVVFVDHLPLRDLLLDAFAVPLPSAEARLRGREHRFGWQDLRA